MCCIPPNFIFIFFVIKPVKTKMFFVSHSSTQENIWVWKCQHSGHKAKMGRKRSIFKFTQLIVNAVLISHQTIVLGSQVYFRMCTARRFWVQTCCLRAPPCLCGFPPGILVFLPQSRDAQLWMCVSCPTDSCDCPQPPQWPSKDERRRQWMHDWMYNHYVRICKLSVSPQCLWQLLGEGFVLSLPEHHLFSLRPAIWNNIPQSISSCLPPPVGVVVLNITLLQYYNYCIYTIVVGRGGGNLKN